MKPLVLVFVHGYSVTSFDTYGGLPARLVAEAAEQGYEARVETLFLGRYISFNDDVKLDDVSNAMEAAVRDQVLPSLAPGQKFICITHSTGGPVVRNWLRLHYQL